MNFGVFDQNDRSGLPLAEQYEKRLALAEQQGDAVAQTGLSWEDLAYAERL